MKIKLLVIALTFTQISFGMQPFEAEYEVFRDDKILGSSSVKLSKSDNYTLSDITKGTHGLASILGFSRFEETQFSHSGELFNPINYQMKQKVAFRKRQSNYKIFDGKITGKSKGGNWELNKPETFFSTPNLVKLNLAADVCNGKIDNLVYPVIDKAKVKNMTFILDSVKENIYELSIQHNKDTRSTKLWLDKNKNCLSVRTIHIEKGEKMETKLISYKNI